MKLDDLIMKHRDDLEWVMSPFPHAIIDNFFPQEIFNQISDIKSNDVCDLKRQNHTSLEFNKKEFGIETKVFTKEEFNEIGHGGNEQYGAMSYKPGFAINPLKFLLGLADEANKSGVKIFQKSKVSKIEKSKGKFKIISHITPRSYPRRRLLREQFHMAGQVKEKSGTGGGNRGL